MTIGGSIILILIGAILRFAVTAEMSGIDLNAVGVILMIGGGIGFLVGLILWQQRGSGTTRTIERTVDEPEAF